VHASQHTGIRGVPHSTPLHPRHGSPAGVFFFTAITCPYTVWKTNALLPYAAPAVVISAPTRE
jgi:hypothetical protein